MWTRPPAKEKEKKIMADKFIVLGKKKVKTSKGNDFYQYYFARPFTPYESNNSLECLGMAVETENSAIDFPVMPDDIVELSYSKGYQNQATLSDIKIVQKKIK